MATTIDSTIKTLATQAAELQQHRVQAQQSI